MKVVLTTEEVARIVEKEMFNRGLKVKEGSFTTTSHVEGQYDDAREVVNGFAVELED